MNLIIGLGNPGAKYEKTRHNAGFLALDYLVKKLDKNSENNLWKFDKKFNANILKLNETVLVEPQTFMNLSGESVRKVMDYYKLTPKNIIGGVKKESDLSGALLVIHDDLDLDLGKYKISVDSRSAGHRGVQSIIDHLKTKRFRRLRIGVRTEMLSIMGAEKFVLENFRKDELDILEKTFEEGLKELKLL